MSIDLEQVKLVATDLDGTLLRNDGSISPRTIQALTEVTSAGLHVVFVTARPPRFVRSLFDTLSLDPILALCCNGAVTYDLVQDTITHHQCLDGAIAQRLAQDLQTLIPGTCFAVEMGFKYGWEPEYAKMDGALVESGGAESDLASLCDGPVTKLIARHVQLSAAELLPFAREAAGERAIVTHSGTLFVEISAPGVEKASALERLTHSLGICSREVIAFGDMPNDIPLLRWAGIPIATSNAHPDVLSVAHFTTTSNEEDGVAAVLEQIPLSVVDRTRAYQSTGEQ